MIVVAYIDGKYYAYNGSKLISYPDLSEDYEGRN